MHSGLTELQFKPYASKPTSIALEPAIYIYMYIQGQARCFFPKLSSGPILFHRQLYLGAGGRKNSAYQLSSGIPLEEGGFAITYKRDEGQVNDHTACAFGLHFWVSRL
jgi:hypothetical protein